MALLNSGLCTIRGWADWRAVRLKGAPFDRFWSCMITVRPRIEPLDYVTCRLVVALKKETLCDVVEMVRVIALALPDPFHVPCSLALPDATVPKAQPA